MKNRKKLKKHIIIYLFCTGIGSLPCISCDKDEGERISLFPTHSSATICGTSSFSMSKFSFSDEMGLHGKSDSESQEDSNLYEAITTSIGTNMIDWKSGISIQLEKFVLYQPESVASVSSITHNSTQYLNSSNNKNHNSWINESSTSSYGSETATATIIVSQRRTNQNVPKHKICPMNASFCLITAEERADLLRSNPIQITNQPITPMSVGSLSSNSNLIEDKKEKERKKRRTSKPSKTSKKTIGY